MKIFPFIIHSINALAKVIENYLYCAYNIFFSPTIHFEPILKEYSIQNSTELSNN
jgi:hypothetical protein